MRSRDSRPGSRGHPDPSLALGTVVRGGIRGDGDLEILGRVEGSVVVDGEVVVGEGALVKSDVRGRRGNRRAWPPTWRAATGG